MRMLQYLLWTNCNNNCKFCIRGDKNDAYTNIEDMIVSIQRAKEDIINRDWTKYSGGISIIGGEIFFSTDIKLQRELFDLFDTVIQSVLTKNENTHLVLITNLLYNPEFLLSVLNNFNENKVLSQIQLHTSYDVKYRFHTTEDLELYKSNLKRVRSEYPTLAITVQNILTQYFIDAVNNNKFNIDEFEDEFNVKFALLIPLKSNLSTALPDFFPKRSDFLNFLIKIATTNPIVFRKFIDSSRYAFISKDFIDTQNDKELKPSNSAILYPSNMKCGHSDIYQCYSDSDKCMLCDVEALCQRGGSKLE